jgi:hypothetical protein
MAIPVRVLPALAVVASGLWLALPAGPAAADPKCTCRYGGESHALDTCVCLPTANGFRRACCGLVLNNTSWRFDGTACGITAAPPEPDPATRPDGDRTRS